jgi:hypothetical protein
MTPGGHRERHHPNPGGRCQVDWCQEPAGHTTNHVAFVGVVEPTPWSDISAVVVSVQCGPHETKPLPVVGSGSKLTTPHVQARLTGAGCATLGRLLADAERRYG